MARNGGVSVLVSLCLAFLWGACVEVERRFCRSDEDCPEGARCIREGGVEACRPALVEGSGGVGGHGGAGGQGGTGGSSAFEAELRIRLVPDAALAASPIVSERRLRVMRLYYRFSTADPEEHVELRFEEGRHLPTEPLSIRLPLPAPEATLKGLLQLEAHRRDGSLAPFGGASVDASVEAHEAKEVTVEIALDPAFDWDGDGDPDQGDCAPSDPGRNRDKLEICDGIREGCTPYCLLPLEDEREVLALRCSKKHRKCAVILSGEEARTVEIFEADAPWLRVEVPGTEAPVDLDWSEADRTLVILDELGLRFAGSDGVLLPPILRLYAGFFVRMLPDGSLGAAVNYEPSAFTFRPTEVATTGEETSCDGGLCEESAILGFENAEGILLTYLEEKKRARLYVIREYFASLAFIELDPLTLKKPLHADGSVRALHPSFYPRALWVSGEGLVVGGLVEPDQGIAGWVRITDALREPAPDPFTLPKAACPVAFDDATTPDALLMADDCNGSLWELPVDVEGRPTGEDFRRLPLTRCDRPTHLASIPASAGEEASAFVGCGGESHIVVYGRY